MVPKTVSLRRKYFSDLVGSQKEKNFFHLWRDAWIYIVDRQYQPLFQQNILLVLC